MVPESGAQLYERGQKLAEAGRLDEAMKCFAEYLECQPKDYRVWNDAGAVLHCQGKAEQAFEYFEKALAVGGGTAECTQIYWNLCEAYIAGGHPELAAGLFDRMEQLEILSADVVNRTANVFLQQEQFGNAIEMLLVSCALSPGQPILAPMMEVIRSKRARIAFFAQAENESLTELFDFCAKRFVAEKHIGMSAERIGSIMQWNDISWFHGCAFLSGLMESATACRVIVSLSSDDILYGNVEGVRWENVEAVVLQGGLPARRLLAEKVPDIDSRTRIITACHVVDTDRFGFISPCGGKKIACVTDMSTRGNVMFILQCMQKLKYCDSAYRLYFAGGFRDKAVELYAKHIIRALGIEDVVFFDAPVNDIKNWLADKHYVVSAGIGDWSLPDVLKGMACGLKPVVHNFPRADELLDREFLFNLSEDFCRQILSDTYEPARYRQIAESRYSSRPWMKKVNDILTKLEKDIFITNKPLYRLNSSEKKVGSCVQETVNGRM